MRERAGFLTRVAMVLTCPAMVALTALAGSPPS